MTDETQAWIAETVRANPVVLFMKGTRQFPQCGFSATVVGVLQQLGTAFRDINVLDDDRLREGIKAYSNWPTIPQLYVKGELVGGCDIVREMYEAGELQDLLAKTSPSEAGQRTTGSDQMPMAGYDIDVHALAGMRADGIAHTVLDVREPDEVAICAIEDSVSIPMQQVPQQLVMVPSGRRSSLSVITGRAAPR
jgi:monothiol glutaredoxin